MPTMVSLKVNVRNSKYRTVSVRSFSSTAALAKSHLWFVINGGDGQKSSQCLLCSHGRLWEVSLCSRAVLLIGSKLQSSSVSISEPARTLTLSMSTQIEGSESHASNCQLFWSWKYTELCSRWKLCSALENSGLLAHRFYFLFVLSSILLFKKKMRVIYSLKVNGTFVYHQNVINH